MFVAPSYEAVVLLLGDDIHCSRAENSLRKKLRLCLRSSSAQGPLVFETDYSCLRIKDIEAWRELGKPKR